MAKILVGTLYSGENEYEECLAAINNQTYKDFDHIVIKDLPELEAHNKLYKTFIEHADTYELLVKVDADMVICSPNLFAEIIKVMMDRPDIDVYSIAVQDFFSGILINGLNTYRNTVQWDFQRNTIFVDIPEVTREKTFYDQEELAPAAIHCKNPSKIQAFRYGLHRGLKSIQRIHSTTHWAFLEKTWKNFLKSKDLRIGLAVLGAELVYMGEFNREDVDYTNPKITKFLEHYKDLNSNEIRREIIKLRIRNWGLMPGDLRRRIIRWRRWNDSRPQA